VLCGCRSLCVRVSVFGSDTMGHHRHTLPTFNIILWIWQIVVQQTAQVS